ncbi:MAG: D-alanyl-D-alanine carboxypeptidase [Coriobacteriia bacterium]|nr:D-alanyl-D-alanine carboxypeptidase [Coriobacteriia bacterium]
MTVRQLGDGAITNRLKKLQHLTTLVSLAAAVMGFPAAARASASPPISVPSGLLMTMDGHVLWQTHPTQTRHVASTIKMLNALVVREHANLSDVVVVTRQSEISNGGVRLQAGQRLTVQQLLDIMLIHSANDAAMALAIHVGGSEGKFVAMMNAKAASLGLGHTHAVDPNGLSGREVSNADDLAVLGRHIMADPVLRQIVGQSKVSVPRPNGTSVTYASSDLLMGHYAGLEGIKTGFTSGAGFCYVGAAKRNGVELLGVVLGTPSEAARFNDMRKLFNWGFANCKVRTLVSADETHTAEQAGSRVTLYASRAATGVVFAPGGPVIKRVVLLSPDAAKSAADGQIATLVVSQGGTVLARVPLLSSKRASAGRSPIWAVALWVLAAVVLAAAVAAAVLLRRGPPSSGPGLGAVRRSGNEVVRGPASNRAEALNDDRVRRSEHGLREDAGPPRL